MWRIFFKGGPEVAFKFALCFGKHGQGDDYGSVRQIGAACKVGNAVQKYGTRCIKQKLFAVCVQFARSKSAARCNTAKRIRKVGLDVGQVVKGEDMVAPGCDHQILFTVRCAAGNWIGGVNQAAQNLCDSPCKGGDLLCLLAIADNADDNGFAWPAVPTIARKAAMGERGAQKCIKKLTEAGATKRTPTKLLPMASVIQARTKTPNRIHRPLVHPLRT